MKFSFVSVILKYFNCARFSKKLCCGFSDETQTYG